MKFSDDIADQYLQGERVYKKRNDPSTSEVRVSTLPFVFVATSSQAAACPAQSAEVCEAKNQGRAGRISRLLRSLHTWPHVIVPSFL